MYFWRLERLKREMAIRPLSESETLPYLVAYVAFTTALFFIPYTFSNVWDTLGAVFSTVLAVVGTIYVYRQNGGADGQYFLQRYFAISWVVTLRWLVILIITTVIFYILLELASVWSEETTWYEFIFSSVFEVIIYQRTGHHVRDVAQRTITTWHLISALVKKLRLWWWTELGAIAIAGVILPSKKRQILLLRLRLNHWDKLKNKDTT